MPVEAVTAPVIRLATSAEVPRLGRRGALLSQIAQHVRDAPGSTAPRLPSLELNLGGNGNETQRRCHARRLHASLEATSRTVSTSAGLM